MDSFLALTSNFAIDTFRYCELLWREKKLSSDSGRREKGLLGENEVRNVAVWGSLNRPNFGVTHE